MSALKRIKRMDKLKLIVILALVSLMISCQPSRKISGTEISSVETNDPMMQSEDALLSGVSKAICYSGFRTGQHPDRGQGAKNPSYEEILEDLLILSGDVNFQLIRLYDSGENSQMVLEVIRENGITIKVMLGIWLKAELSNHESCAWLTEPIPEETLLTNRELNLMEIERGIELANQYKEIVVAVNVGNEALVDWNDHKVNTDTIINYVKYVKKEINQPVTVAENYKWWADNGFSLAKEVDFLSVHVYPIWEGKGIEEGLSYSIENIMEIKKAIPNAIIVVSEAGWPTVASEFSDQANENNQLRYYTEFMEWSEEMNITTFWFEAFDEDWKGNPDNMMGAEKHWGLFTVDRKPKKVMHQFYNEMK
jgi:exo-beta-1,3-glucanase (GH17 family)